MLGRRLSLVLPRNLHFHEHGSYVEKVRLLDYWKLNDDALMREFVRSRMVLMLDRKPLIMKGKDGEMCLKAHSFLDMKRLLGEYGVNFDIRQSSLLDAIMSENDELIPLFGVAVKTESPPADSPIQKSDVINKLAASLGGTFIDLRMAMLTLPDEKQRNTLAKFQSLSRWTNVFLRCPKCASPLKMRASKSGASCTQCDRVFYPTFSPVTITLVRDETNEFCLLVRHRGSVNGVYTCVAGFAHSGESLIECARREVAEEVGIDCGNVRALDMSQPWPMPDSSLMVAHVAIADRHQKIDCCPSELESARWFSREQVRIALQRTTEDPFLRGLPRSLDERQNLHYIPPHGAIAHQIIKKWVENKY